MNGLEAIKAMLEGKVVTDGKYLYKEIDGDICFKGEDVCEYTCDNEFNFASDYEEYIEPKPLTGWERVNEEVETYYSLARDGVSTLECSNWALNQSYYDDANYFSTKEKAEEINFKQTLFRKLQRFSDENGGNEIVRGQKASTIFHDASGRFEILNVWNNRIFGNVVFASEEVAEKAIELFRDDLIKYFTHDWSGKNE